jgi:serine/threonine protein phosphatase PrpC
MLRVAEQYAGTDTGRQRRANEDSVLARAPLFVVADGMGGARAGEVASRIAVESFAPGIGGADDAPAALAKLVREANARIYERSHRRAEEAGMGTTLTAMYVGAQDVTIAHVGDSRAYRMRAGVLERLTDDHSLVDELIREGRLTPEEALEHPQRSVITRALGNESDVEVDTHSLEGLAGDVYLLCSDGLTTMVDEDVLAAVLRGHPRLRDAGEALIAAANEAGGRDNITVVLVRVESVAAPRDGAAPHTPAQTPRARGEDEADTAAYPIVAPTAPAQADTAGEAPDHAHAVHAAPDEAAATPPTGLESPPGGPVKARPPRRGPARDGAQRARGRRSRRPLALLAVTVVLALIAAGGYLFVQSVYFLGTNGRGLVTLYRGIPIRLPGSIALYSSDYVSGVSASTLPAERRRKLLDHSLRSEANAVALLRGVELGQVE